jgi:phthiodiolone/phenolphthiodiolone dimycocerosates ketoreductase
MSRVTVGCLGDCLYPLWTTDWTFRVARLAGANALWVPDHFVGFLPEHVWNPQVCAAAKLVPSTDAFFDPFQVLASAARRYRKVALGTAVTEAFRNHPARLAQAFVTLDHLSKGRAILGIGNGERENVEPFGIPFAKRVARLEEALTIIDLLWNSGGKPVEYDGQFWRLRDAKFALPLYQGQRPRIWIAAHAPRMLGLAGRFGDGWLPTTDLEAARYAACLAAIEETAAAAGRSMNGFVPGLVAIVAVGRSRQEILEKALASRLGAALALSVPAPTWARAGKQHPLGEKHGGYQEIVPSRVTPEHIDAALERVTPEILSKICLAGSPNQIVEQLVPWVDAGARHIVLWNQGQEFAGGGLSNLWYFASLVRKLKRL